MRRPPHLLYPTELEKKVMIVLDQLCLPLDIESFSMIETYLQNKSGNVVDTIVDYLEKHDVQ